jgi:hypothetical protein
MTPLSPAAQAIDSAVYGPGPGATRRDTAAAALRAAAPMMECVQDHLKLLAIAAELVAPTTQVRRTNDDSHHK